jgi:flagellar motility protein MotE (MotC chaperone)
LLSPLRTGPQRWQPHEKKISVYSSRDSKEVQHWNLSEQVSWLDVRTGVSAPRTAVCATKAKTAKQSGEQWIILKVLWMTMQAMWDEIEMLKYLHGSATPGIDALRLAQAPIAEENIDPRVIACLPRAVGLVKDLLDRPMETQDYHYQTLGLSLPTHKLQLTAIVMSGTLGKTLPSKPDGFGIRKWTRVMKGVFESLWHTSSKGMHYRDINSGNIMWIEDPVSGEVVGWLIDYGNVRYLNQNRLVPRGDDVNGVMLLCEDDARSITRLFQSISSLEATAITSKYISMAEKLKSALKTHEEQVRRAEEGTQVEKTRNLLNLEDAVRKQIEQAEKLPHRYVDDLESGLYCFLYMVGFDSLARHISMDIDSMRQVHEVTRSEDLVNLNQALSSLESKREQWDEGLCEVRQVWTDDFTRNPTDVSIWESVTFISI